MIVIYHECHNYDRRCTIILARPNDAMHDCRRRNIIIIMIIINNNNIHSGRIVISYNHRLTYKIGTNTAVDRWGGGGSRTDSGDLYFGRVPIPYILARAILCHAAREFVIVFLSAVVRTHAHTHDYNIIIVCM